MNEWPIVAPAAAQRACPELGRGAEQSLLPLAMPEHVAAILAGDAARAFAEVRAAQLLDFGHRPEDDARHTIDYLPRQARDRVQAFLERSGRDRMAPPPDHRLAMLRYLAVAGGILLAAYDRLLMDPGEDANG